MKAIVLISEEETIEKDKPNALVQLCGLTLLERNLFTLKQAGIGEFLIVCGSQYDIIKNFIENKKLSENFNLNLFRKIDDLNNDNEIFVVLLDAIIFDFDIIKNLIVKNGNDSIICIDSSPKYIRIDKDLSKQLANVGIFLCSRKLTATQSIIKSPFIYEHIIDKLKIKLYDVKGDFWFRINSQQDLKSAENYLLNLIPVDEDFIGTYIRKNPAKFIIKHLINTSLTPNQISVLTFLSLVLAAFFLSFGKYNYNIIAGIMMLIALILDHCDGGIARLKFSTSRFGAWLDDILDTIGFYAVIIGVTIGLYIQSPSPLPWIVGMLLLFSDSVVYHDSSLSKRIFGAGVKNIITTVTFFKKETLFMRFYNFIKKGLYLSWAGKLLLISIGAFLNSMLIFFSILIVFINVQWLTILFMRFKNKNSMK